MKREFSPVHNGLLRALVCFTLLLACASHKAKRNVFDDPENSQTNQSPELYQKAMKELKQGRDKLALELFDLFTAEQPLSPYTEAAVYNSARALENLRQYQSAAERYRSVARMASTTAPHLQALALYRLSFCEEALGDDIASIATLRDAQLRASVLPREVAQAELPARLAAAYARKGNMEESNRYYKEGEAGLIKLRRTLEPGKIPEWFPKTLFYMGQVTLRKTEWQDFEASVQPIERAQLYLLEAAESDVAPWARRAADELIESYQQMWNVLSERPPIDTSKTAKQADVVTLDRANQEKQWAMAERVLSLEQELKAAKAPGQESSLPVQSVFQYLGDLEQRLTTLLHEPKAGSGLTPEAESLRSSVRGKTKVEGNAGSDLLERQYVPLKKTLPKSKIKDLPSNKPNSKANNKPSNKQDKPPEPDPNL